MGSIRGLAAAVLLTLGILTACAAKDHGARGKKVTVATVAVIAVALVLGFRVRSNADGDGGEW